jgi:hypothetical protein
VPRVVLFDIEPSMTVTVRASALGELVCTGNLVNENLGSSNNWAKAQYKKTGHEFS